MVRSQVPDVLVPGSSGRSLGFAAFALARAHMLRHAVAHGRGSAPRPDVPRAGRARHVPRGDDGQRRRLRRWTPSHGWLRDHRGDRGRDRHFKCRRIAQLTQHTNQFNLTTRRYSEADVRTRSANRAWRVYTLSLRDRLATWGSSVPRCSHANADAWETRRASPDELYARSAPRRGGVCCVPRASRHQRRQAAARRVRADEEEPADSRDARPPRLDSRRALPGPEPRFRLEDARRWTCHPQLRVRTPEDS